MAVKPLRVVFDASECAKVGVFRGYYSWSITEFHKKGGWGKTEKSCPGFKKDNDGTV